MEMDGNGEGIDVVTVGQRLRERNQFDAVGGQEFLDRVQDSVPGHRTLITTSNILHGKFRLRAFAHATREAKDVFGRASQIRHHLSSEKYARTIDTLAGIGAAQGELEKVRVNFDPANPPPPLRAHLQHW
jgi:replicative DNA helicase